MVEPCQSNLNAQFGSFLGLQYEFITKIYSPKFQKKMPFFGLFVGHCKKPGNFRFSKYVLKCHTTSKQTYKIKT